MSEQKKCPEGKHLTKTGKCYPNERKSRIQVKHKELVLERRSVMYSPAQMGIISKEIIMTPVIGEDYWDYRVKLSDKQAVIGFKKFNTIGIGFAVEEDWNTNLPYQSSTQEIFNHIKHNKLDMSILNSDVIKAIVMIQKAAMEDRSKLSPQ